MSNENTAVTKQGETATAVAAPKKAAPTIRSLISGEEFKAQIAMALPKHITPDRFIRVALTAMQKTPKLLDCTQASLFQSLLTCSQLGIEPDGRMAHLIPYGNVCQLIIDYKGLSALAMRSGEILPPHADVVCENDVFEYDRGEVKKHSIDFRKPRGKAYAVYAIVRYKEGGEKAECMSIEEVDAIRKRSKASGSGPWVTDFNEMAKKGLATDTPIPTPSGWVNMGSLFSGASVFDMNGKPTKVIARSEIKHLPCYRITFGNGDSIICDNEHKWVALVGSNASFVRKISGWKTYGIAELFKLKSEGTPITVPVSKPLMLNHADLRIDPWLLGYWLGNGNKINAAVTCHSDDTEEVIGRVVSSRYTLGSVRADTRSKAVCVRIKNGFLDDLRTMGLIGNKHIPQVYLRASKDQRLELLKGMMDSDGCIEKERGNAIFASRDECLSDGVAELAASLGEVVHRTWRLQTGYGVKSGSFRVEWKPATAPVSLFRKLRNFKPRKLDVYRSVKSIVKVDSVPTMCIAVDSPTKTYLAGETMVPTHNTVFRRLSKWLPLSPEFRDAIDADADGPVDISKQVEVMDRTPRNKLFEAAAETTATEAPATAIDATATETPAPAVETPAPEAGIDEQITELVEKLSAAKVTKAMKAAGIAFDEGADWSQEPLDKRRAVLSLLKSAK